MRTIERNLAINPQQICYNAAKMTFFLFLLFVQMSCGSAAGTTGSSITAVSSVAKLTPDNGSAEVPTSGIVSVSFNSDMDASSLNSNTFQISGPDGAISGSISYDGARTATFAPTAPLMPQANYTATLTTGVKDNNGVVLSSNSTWNFKTGNDVLARSAQDVIPTTLFGLHIFNSTTGTQWPTSKFGAWRLWDAKVNWMDLEPNKGEWHFEKLDKYVALAEKNGVEIVLNFAYSPTWASARPTEANWGAGHTAEPTNIEDWKNYVRTVATRYKGRIHYYEIWNEPQNKGFYTGSVEKMVELAREAYAITKAVDPTVSIITPPPDSNSGLSWLDEYLSKGGGDYADIIGYHFYVADGAPEVMLDLINKVKAIIAKYHVIKPLWNTETGWLVQNHLSTVAPILGFKNVLSDEQASSYVARAFILNWASGIDRFFWYGWDSSTMALVEADGKTLKPPAIAYNMVYSWLNGAKMISCGKSTQGTWVTDIVRDAGYKAWIIWTESDSETFDLPKEWSAVQMRDLAGCYVLLSSIEPKSFRPANLRVAS